MAKKPTLRIGVFCSAADGIAPEYFEATRQLGAWLGSQHWTLVYGGANCGLMGELARTVKAHGGQLCGMVPPSLQEKGLLQADLDEVYPCQSLTDRKDLMIAQSDVLIALPGGVGTLDEIFTLMGSSSIGYHSKQILLYNVGGFWDPLVALLQHLKDQGFLRHEVSHYCTLVDDLEQLQSLITGPC